MRYDPARGVPTEAGVVVLLNGQVIHDEAARATIGDAVVRDEDGPVEPMDGPDYMRGLLLTFAGMYLWAEGDFAV